LAAEQVTCVVMEATSDYWKPFYYLLEELPEAEVLSVDARHVKTCPVVRLTSLMPPGWLSSARMGQVRVSLCRPSRAGSCVIQPGPGQRASRS